MDSLLENRLSNLTKACAGIALALTTVCPSHAVIVVTSDPAVAAAFQSGAALELFDDLTAFPITSYGPGQTIDPGAKFSSRDGATQPTYHSGGASFNNPVGNPGTPIGIFHPQGGIAADVVSSPNVAGPLVINSDEPFNNGFMEVIFPDEVGLVGFWVTSGGLSLTLRDNTGSDLTGDFSATVTAGQFVGISRDNSDVKIAALLGNGTDHFTIDDFTYRPAGSPSSPGVPEGGSVFTLALAAGFLWFTNRRFNLERRRASKNV